MLYNRINQFLERFNITLNSNSGSHNWTELDALNEFNENITLSHIINFFSQNDSLDVGSDMLNMTETFRQLDESIDASFRLGINSTAVDLVAFSHNVSSSATKGDSDAEPLFVLISVTICYLFIFVAGVLGNVITCTVISRNKSMHTATNYYLFNLAISDLILLLSGKLAIHLSTHSSHVFHSLIFTNISCTFLRSPDKSELHCQVIHRRNLLYFKQSVCIGQYIKCVCVCLRTSNDFQWSPVAYHYYCLSLP